MSTFTLAEAKAQLSRLISIVKLVPSDPPLHKMPSLVEHRAQMTPQAESAGEFMRKLRESDRY